MIGEIEAYNSLMVYEVQQYILQLEKGILMFEQITNPPETKELPCDNIRAKST